MRLFSFRHTVPRWVILVIDLTVTIWSFCLSYLIVKNFEFSEILQAHFILYISLYTLISLSVFYVMKIYACLLRYSNTLDMLRIFLAVFIVTWFYLLLVPRIVAVFDIQSLNIGRLLLTNFFINSSMLIALRIGVKGFYYYRKQISNHFENRVLIHGSDDSAILIKRAIESLPDSNFIVEGFIDTDRHKINTFIEQVKVYHIEYLIILKYKRNVKTLIMLRDKCANQDKQMLIERCLYAGIKVLLYLLPTSGYLEI